MSTDATALAAAAGSVDPRELAAVIATLGREELREVLVDEVRQVVVDEVVARFPAFVDPARLPAEPLLAAFAIRDARGFRVRLDPSGCEAGHALPGTPDVTLDLSTADLLRLVTANADAAVLLLAGELRVSGRARRAVDLAGAFRVPAAGGDTRVDPAGADPAAIAAVVRAASDRELRERLAGDVRDLVLEEVFRRMAEHARPERIEGLHATIGWRITGREDGGYDRWTVFVADGRVRAERDAEAETRVTLRMDAVEFLKLATGNANPVLDYVRGRIKLKGDLGFASRLAGLFHIPAPAEA